MRWSWVQYRLKSLLLACVAFSVACSWLGWKIDQARRQRDAVKRLASLGVRALYSGLPIETCSGKRGSDCVRPEESTGLLFHLCHPVWCVVFPPDTDDAHLCDAMPSLMGLGRMRAIGLDGTKIGDTAAGKLRSLKGVTQLELGRTRVTDRGIAEIAENLDLVSLQLDGTSVSDDATESIGQMGSLVFLSLAGTHVTDKGVASLQGMPRLAVLDLSDTQVTDDCLDFIRTLPALETVKLIRTAVSAQALEERLDGLPREDPLHVWWTAEDRLYCGEVRHGSTDGLRSRAVQWPLD